MFSTKHVLFFIFFSLTYCISICEIECFVFVLYSHFCFWYFGCVSNCSSMQWEIFAMLYLVGNTIYLYLTGVHHVLRSYYHYQIFPFYFHKNRNHESIVCVEVTARQNYRKLHIECKYCCIKGLNAKHIYTFAPSCTCLKDPYTKKLLLETVSSNSFA